MNPVLPKLGLPALGVLSPGRHVAARAPEPFVRAAEWRFREARRHLEEASRRPRRGSTSVRPAGKTELIGFYVNWDDTSFTSLKENIGRIDKLVPEWLHLGSADGSIVVDDPPKQRQALTLVHEVRPGLPITPLVNNFDSASMTWQGEKLGAMLADPVARQRAIDGLLRIRPAGAFPRNQPRFREPAEGERGPVRTIPRGGVRRVSAARPRSLDLGPDGRRLLPVRRGGPFLRRADPHGVRRALGRDRGRTRRLAGVVRPVPRPSARDPPGGEGDRGSRELRLRLAARGNDGDRGVVPGGRPDRPGIGRAGSRSTRKP